MPEWDAELEVDEALVASLLREQVPTLVIEDLRPFAQGWDNAIWLVNGTLAFRFPRRRIAIAGVEREIEILPRLSALLPLPIPDPVHVGRPSPRFPWPFFGSRLLPGREVAGMPLDSPARVAYGASLGAFLAVLHEPGLAEEIGEGLPGDFNGRADMAVRVPRTRDRLAAVEKAGLWAAPRKAQELLEEAVALGPAPGRSIVHGDLHVRHVLVGEDGRPSAVIDWGDVCIADPSVDLSLYWSVLDAAGRAAFREAYGTIPHDRLLRARVLALFLNAVLLQYADDISDRALRDETIDGLERTLVDS